MTTNILLALIAVLLLARIVLQVWQGKETIKRAYATVSEVEHKAVVVPCSLVKMNNILTHMAMNEWELVGACAGEDDTLLLFFTRKKIKSYMEN